MHRICVWALLVLGLIPACAQESARENKLTYYYMAAMRAKNQEDYVEMMEMLGHCRDLDSLDAATNFEMGVLYYSMGMDSLGLSMVEYASKADAGNPWYLEQLALMYLRKNRTEKALPVLERLAYMQTKRTDVLAQLFSLYRQLGRTADAIRTLERMQTLQGRSPQVAEQLFRLYMDQGEEEKAFDQLRAVCREFPYDASCQVMLGAYFMENEQMDSARVYLDRAEQIDPTNVNLLLTRLQGLREEGDTVAFRQRRDSLVLDERADLNLRMVLLRDLMTEAVQDSVAAPQVQRLMQRLMAEEKPQVDFLRLYKDYDAYLHQDSSNYTNLELAERILSLDPADLQSQMTVLAHYIHQNNADSLQHACQKFLVYNPQEVVFHYYLALTYLSQSDDLRALEALKAGVRQTEGQQEEPLLVAGMYSLLGDTYHSLHREREAFEAYDSCLVYNPDEVSCLNNYAYFLSVRGEQLDRAEQMGYRAVKAEPENKTYLDTYAWVLYMQQDYTTARLYMERAVNPERTDEQLLADEEISAMLLEHAGDIWEKCGQRDVALRLWQLALEKTEAGEEVSVKALKKKIKKTAKKK